jgi:transposase InsO family protein
MPFTERTIVDLREEMARKAADPRFTVEEVAEMFGVSRPTVRLWRERYRQEGRAGLEDRSHAPHSCRHKTAEPIEQLIVEQRMQWGWGSKKILQRLREAHPGVTFPKRATVDAILARHGLIQRRRRRHSHGQNPTFARRYQPVEPGELMTIDFKGQFRLRNGCYCYPLTIADSFSRYLLACEALEATSLSRTWPVLLRVFRQYGLPRALQSDNGAPFGPTNGRFSTMSVRLMSLGIQPIFSRPGRPSDNGRHERMHRDLKATTTRPPEHTFAAQQRRFDAFRHIYNVERPHEGIDMQRPGRLFRRSPRVLPHKPNPPDYPLHFETRRVGANGCVQWGDRVLFLSEAFAGQTIGLEPIDDGLWSVWFHHFVIGKFDQRRHEFL